MTTRPFIKLSTGEYTYIDDGENITYIKDDSDLFLYQHYIKEKEKYANKNSFNNRTTAE